MARRSDRPKSAGTNFREACLREGRFARHHGPLVRHARLRKLFYLFERKTGPLFFSTSAAPTACRSSSGAIGWCRSTISVIPRSTGRRTGRRHRRSHRPDPLGVRARDNHRHINASGLRCALTIKPHPALALGTPEADHAESGCRYLKEFLSDPGSHFPRLCGCHASIFS